MMRPYYLATALAVAAIQSSPASAAAPQTGQTPPADIERRLSQAATFGGILYAFDHAASVATDALTAQIGREDLDGMGGYVVEPAGDDALTITFFHGEGATARAFFVVGTRSGIVTRSELLTQLTPLTEAQAKLAKARAIALREAAKQDYRPCTNAPFKTVVLPLQKDGLTIVYLLSAQIDAQAFPLGGAYRVIVGSLGQPLSSRPYAVSCLTMQPPRLPSGNEPVGMVVSHLLDPVPTEIHVFASLTLGMPLFVATSDKSVWQVSGTRIQRASMRR